MSIEIGVVQSNLANNKVIVSEKKINKQHATEKFYLVDADKADKFIKCKKNNEFSDNFQKGLSVAAAGSIGLLIGANMKSSNLLIKIGTGIVSAIGSLVGLSLIDSALDKWLNKIAMNKFKVTEISKEDISISEQPKPKENESLN